MPMRLQNKRLKSGNSFVVFSWDCWDSGGEDYALGGFPTVASQAANSGIHE